MENGDASGYSARLKAAMDLAEMDRKALAAGMRISVQGIGDALLGKTKAFSAMNNAVAARVMEVDAHWLATGEGEARPPMMKERAALSLRAVALGWAFDHLSEPQKELWRTLVLTASTQLEPTIAPNQLLTDLTAHPQTDTPESGRTDPPVDKNSGRLLERLKRLDGVKGERSKPVRAPKPRRGGGA